MRQSRRSILRTTSILAAALASSGTATGTTESYPSWDDTAAYTDGDRVVHDGTVWEAQWWTRGDEPDDTASVWNRLGSVDGQSEYPAWTPDGVYRAGNRVVHDGTVWEAQWWTSGDDPSSSPSWGPWERVDRDDDEQRNDEPAPPAAPTDLVVTNVGPSSVSLAWNHDFEESIASYRVYRDTGTEVTADSDHLIGDPEDTTYTDSGLESGVSYTYTVTAVDGDDVEGPTSSETTVETDPEDDVTDSETPVIGYYTSWSRYDRNYFPEDVPFDRLTHVNYAFLDVQSDGEVVLADPAGDQQNLEAFRALKADHPDTKLLLSIGGWTLSENFSDGASTQQNRERFARSAIELLRQYNFDGLDIDWEYPTGGGQAGNTERPSDPENFILLLEELRTQLDDAGREDDCSYELTVAVGGGKRHVDGLDTDAMNDYVDYVTVMTYDYVGTWSSTTGFNAPLYRPSGGTESGSVDDSMRYWSASGIDDDKLILGLAFYSRGFASVPDRNNGLHQPFSGTPSGGWAEPGMADYQYVESELLSDSSYQSYWHDEAKVPWVYSPEEQVMVTYDGPRSIALKTEYAIEEAYGGVMCWELYGDRTGVLLEAVHDEL
ncbi:glycosyl hydrolase family 18 protein [Natronorubrum aibiense]|uniref:Uncharacterized protein n=1 Tax=Natronorubrum aibiense TaxID=348826 RepID=A0A5P9P703_9EURY|nr:glycosyl hydrolase family 18 protein [Natronorubrum aibiense]QFU83914.1 hypothetical protein GCU68_15905 [Natronorubrum aibiense]